MGPFPGLGLIGKREQEQYGPDKKGTDFHGK
jgi:hypothetical protein